MSQVDHMNRRTTERRALGLAGASALALALVLAMSTPAQAQWKWRDKSGQTQYSDLPPPSGVQERDILQRPDSSARRPAATPPTASAAASSASAPALLAPRGSEPELEARRRKVEQDEAMRKTTEDARLAAARGENCNRAKAQLRTLDSGMRMAQINEKGEREVLDDAARATETKRIRAIIATDCK